MPHIKLDADEMWVTATLSLVTTKLSDALELVVKQVNEHDDTISSLRDAFGQFSRRLDSVEKEVQRISPSPETQRNVFADIEGLKSGVESVQAQLAGQKEEILAEVDEKQAAMMAQLSTMKDDFDMELIRLDERNKNLTSEMEDVIARLNAMVIPDVAPLAAGLKSIKEAQENVERQIASTSKFVKLWDVVDSDMSAAAAEKDVAAHVKYLHSLPPFLLLTKQFSAKQLAFQEDVEEKVRVVASKMVSKADKDELQKLKDDVEDKDRKLQREVLHSQKRLLQVEETAVMRPEFLDAIAELRDGKADAAVLGDKADRVELEQMNVTLTDASDQISDLWERMAKVHKDGSGRRISIPPPASDKSSGVQGSLESLRKRIGELFDETKRLQREKADRTELAALQQLMEQDVSRVNARMDGLAAAGGHNTRRSSREGGASSPTGSGSATTPGKADRLSRTSSRGGLQIVDDHVVYTSATAADSSGGSPASVASPSSGAFQSGTVTASPRPPSGSSRRSGSLPGMPVRKTSTKFVVEGKGEQISETGSEVATIAPTEPTAGLSTPGERVIKHTMGNSWHVGRGQINVRDISGQATPIKVYAGDHKPPVVYDPNYVGEQNDDE